MNDALNDLLGRVFDEHRNELSGVVTPDEYDQLRHDFAFHMTDWLDDLKKFHAMTEAPEVWSTDGATVFLIGMLYHVIPHLNAAGRLLLDEIGDPFAHDATSALLARAADAGSKSD